MVLRPEHAERPIRGGDDEEGIGEASILLPRRCGTLGPRCVGDQPAHPGENPMVSLFSPTGVVGLIEAALANERRQVLAATVDFTEPASS